MQSNLSRLGASFVALIILLSSPVSHAASASDMALWGGECKNGWQLWTASGICPAASGPSYNGVAAFATTPKFAGAGFQWDHPAFNTAPYTSIDFAINGGTAAGHVLTLSGTRSDGSTPLLYTLPALTANGWQNVSIPLSSLGLEQVADLHHLTIKDTSATQDGTATFYVSDFKFTARQTPTLVTLKVMAGSAIRAIDPRTAGLNVAVWDGTLGNPRSTANVVSQLGTGSLRFPGGSTADVYHWASNTVENYKGGLGSSGKEFAALNEASGTAAYITVNYGSGTPEEAAAWVAWANGSTTSTQTIGTDSRGKNWNTVGYWARLRAAKPLAKDDGLNVLRAAHPASYGWKYFEIGNENYGGWEYDLHGSKGSGLAGKPHEPVTYGKAAAIFINKMKAVDPTIKVGVVAEVGSMLAGRHADDYCSGNCSPTSAVPSKAGGSHYGWTPVMLGQLSQARVKPDFVTYHFYPIYPGLENDALVLDSPATLSVWAARLRSQISNYWTAGDASGIELALGEANIGGTGKQTTSLVNGLFYAEHYGQMLTAGFTSGAWWALHNGEYESGNMSPTLYGTRLYGTEGLASDGDNSRVAAAPSGGSLFPAGQVFAQLKPFRAAGATLVRATSSDPVLSIFASKQGNGQLTVMVINKSPSASVLGAMTLDGVTLPLGVVGVSTYGKTEDAGNAAASSSRALTVGNLLTQSFAPYSVTLLTIPPL